MSPIETTVRDAPERNRFEIFFGEAPAGYAAYERKRGVLAFLHTEIDPAYEGKGLGGKLAVAALDQARADGDAVLPMCPFMRGYIARHREYVDLVPADRRALYDLEGGDG